MPCANPHDKANWNKHDVQKLARPCSKCGALTQFRGGLCRECKKERTAKRRQRESEAAQFSGHSRTLQDQPFDAREICPHPLASRLPAWTGKWCRLCNGEVEA